jgi:glycosyltransferase involved in cell wall biosynthesis
MRGPRRVRAPDADLAAGSLVGCEVLLLNWKGPDHPKAGGAEAYCWELAKPLQVAGIRPLLFTSRHRGAASSDVIDGIEVRRAGGKFTVYARAALFMLFRRHRFAAVLDSQNGIPFFAPLWLARSRTPVICVIHHVHQEQFRQHFNRPVAAIGRFLERVVARHVYGRGAVVTVSPSSRAEIRMRLGLEGPIYVIPNGLTPDDEAPRRRAAEPTIVYLGRLVAHKRIDRLLEACRELRTRWPDLRVEIVGDGDAAPALRRQALALGLGSTARFHGRVGDDSRNRILGEAWLSVMPSEREGWGLTILEANALGVPAVGYDVPGVRDAINDTENGWFVRRDECLTDVLDRALTELRDPARARELAVSCRRWAARFRWDASARQLADLLAAEVRQSALRARRSTTRRIHDCETVVTFDLARELSPAALPIRLSDHRAVHQGRAGLLLHGADIEQALGVLRRLDSPLEPHARVARSLDLLLGPIAELTGEAAD